MEDADLLSYGVGVTDLCDVPSARAADLAPEDFVRGIATLRDRVQQCTPRVLCCNGVGVFRVLFGQGPARIGRQQDLSLEDAVVFVVPSSSGAAGAFAAQRLAGWRELAAFLAET
jgi:TDG/mug DNA glycosylase family protein